MGHAESGEPRMVAVLAGDEVRDRRLVVETRLDDVVPEREHVVALGERGAKLPAGAVVGAGERSFVRDELPQVGAGRGWELVGRDLVIAIRNTAPDANPPRPDWLTCWPSTPAGAATSSQP
jgi:hypothetical protein